MRLFRPRKAQKAQPSRRTTLPLPDLPDDVLIPLFVDIGLDSPRWLLDISLTCRRFAHLLRQDIVWRTIHNEWFDDPRFACAFPSPRSRCRWKENVLDRFWALDILLHKSQPRGLRNFHDRMPGQGLPLYKIRHGNLPKIAPSLFKIVLSLYVDLPAQGSPSWNADILGALADSETFVGVLWSFGEQHEEGDHLTALLCHFPSFLTFSLHDARQTSPHYNHYPLEPRQRPWRDPIQEFHPRTRRLPTEPAGRVEVEEMVSIDTQGSQWAIAARAAHGTQTLLLDHNSQELDNCWRSDPDGISCLRGSGLLGWNSSETDWAGVTGRWCGLLHSCGSGSRMFPGYFTLQLATGPRQIIDKMTSAGVPWTTAEYAWDKLAPEIEACRQTTSPLPTLHFYGMRETVEDDVYSEGVQSIYGFVYYINDPTPEVRWTFAVARSHYRGVEDIFGGRPSPHLSISGIQLGTRGSKRGIVGTWRLVGKMNRYEEHQHLRPIKHWDNNFAWIYKTSDGPS